MESFIYYNQHLREAALKLSNDSLSLVKDEILSTKDAQQYLRDNENINTLRASGVFFTGDALSSECASYIEKDYEELRVLDPCCGTGNLLVAVAKRLEMGNGLAETLVIWNEKLHGFDIFEGFVEATKLNIIIEALKRGAISDGYALEQYLTILSNIRCIDSLKDVSYELSFTHILMNPPYNLSIIDNYNHWKSGKVNLAAVFVDHYITLSKEGTRLIAILPDVLRSGSRYDNWRSFIQKKLSAEIILRGKFDSKTDVDVFILVGTITKSGCDIKWNGTKVNYPRTTISDYFSVSIGKLVPYRDPLIGDSHKYIYPKGMTNWSEIKSDLLLDTIKHSSKPILPPFLVIKRTSSPKDKNRAVAQLITGKLPVFVENHLIVVKHSCSNLEACRKLLMYLRTDEVNAFLNDFIRCRHLTVKSIKMIPFDME